MKYSVVLIDEARTVSPSPRRAWIEISMEFIKLMSTKSPSPRRAWIEISDSVYYFKDIVVALPTEGVD